jgi:THO complex subunit 7
LNPNFHTFSAYLYIPPRSIAELENDMAAIRVEHDAQNRVLLAQKSALDIIVTDLAGLRFIGKDKETMTPSISARATPLPDTDHSGQYLAVELSTRGASSALSQADGSVNEDEGKEEGEDDGEGEGNGSSRMTDDGELNEGDIEMGEVEEEPRNKKLTKAVEEELEEGEASDFSSELSDPPDD